MRTREEIEALLTETREALQNLLREVTGDPQAIACVDLRHIEAARAAIFKGALVPIDATVRDVDYVLENKRRLAQEQVGWPDHMKTIGASAAASSPAPSVDANGLNALEREAVDAATASMRAPTTPAEERLKKVLSKPGSGWLFACGYLAGRSITRDLLACEHVFVPMSGGRRCRFCGMPWRF